MTTRHTHLIALISLLLTCLLLVGGVGALTPYNITNSTPGGTNIIIFNGTAGSTTWTPPSGVNSVDYLVVAGGGAGGDTAGTIHGGGGGAGGFRTGSGFSVIGTINIAVGVGGVLANGGNSVLQVGSGSTDGTDIITSAGGGVGSGTNDIGHDGGSGGGGVSGTGQTNAGGVGNTPSRSPSQGNSGGSSVNDGTIVNNGGGGGASLTDSEGLGGNGILGGGAKGGNGGKGRSSNITGTTVWYAGGGGGGAYTDGGAVTPGVGGQGGGGNGGNEVSGTAGTANTGGGGGGCGYPGSSVPGGSGIVIIRYLTPPLVASFTSTNISVAINGTTIGWAGIAPFIMVFNDTSTGSPLDWNWSYTGLAGSANTTTAVFSTLQNATATFTTGNFSIKHGANNTAGSNISAQTTWINVSWGGSSAFTKSKASIAAGQSVQFNDISTWGLDYERPARWDWQINGTGGGWYNFTALTDARNISHTFNTLGIYNVSLSISNVTLSPRVSTSTQDVTVNTSLVANFGAAPLSGVIPLDVVFVDMSTGESPYGWSWNFGDTGTSTDRNPLHQYTTIGTFTVNLTTTYADGTAFVSKPDYITTNPMVATASGTPTSGIAPFTVTFTGSSTGSPNTYYWEFGDGDTSTSQNPTHEYDTLGTFSVNFKATNTSAGLSDWDNHSGYITTNPMVITPSATNTTGSYPLVVQFGATATGSPNTWYWDFGDSVTSASQNPSHIYTTDGIFRANVSATNTSSGLFVWDNTTTITVTVPIPPANFTANVTTGAQYGLAVKFNDTSTNATSWNWTFGDGGISTAKNPVYIYDVARKYNVSLNITYSGGISIATKTDYINLTADADSYLKSWLHFNGTNGGTVFKGEEGLAWTPTAATTSTTRVKFGYSSGAFLSATSKITTPNNSVLMFGAGDFTIEQWLYPTASGNNQFVISKTTSAKNNGWGLYDTGSNVFAFYMGTSANNTVFTVTQDAWSHVAIERVSGNVTVYVNGVGVATRLFPGSYDTSGLLVYGDAGAGVSQSFRGYIDESRISTVARWGTAFTAPVYEYAGILETIYPDINPDSTMRFKTDPTGQAIISNQTDGGTRNRTIQIQNIVFTNYITGTSSFDSDHLMGLEVNLNTSAYTDMTLISSSIDNTIGPDDLNQYGLVTFNVTRAGGFATIGTERKSIVDIKMLYYNYSPPDDTAEEEVFGSGYLINTTTSKMYPVHNFISTPITYVPWDFYPNFTSDKTTGFAPLTVGFTDTTVGFPNRWNWSWGDGQWTNGTSQTPSHVYTTPGVYTVSMNGTIWQNMSVVNTSIKTGYITVTEPAPVANFAHVPSEGFYPLNVQFTDTSTNTPTSWNWSFGDGSLSTTTNPTHVYSSGGTYQVNLTVNNSNATYSSKLGYVEVWNYTSTTFSGTPVSGVVPLTVTFTDTSSNATNWSWIFGDGGTSIEQNPVYVYNTVGTYSVNHSANNTHHTSWHNESDYITVDPMVATATGTPTTGIVPSLVTFTGSSTGSPNTWYWEFGDGVTSTSQNPTHEYTTIGVYGVNFKATNTSSGQFDWSNQSGYITVNPMIATATGVPTTGVVPFTVTFTGSSTGSPNTWYWSFGDGVTSTTQSPTHSYTVFGSYDVNFKSTNTSSGAFDWHNQSGYITALEPAPVANFTQNVTAGFYSLPVLFTDTSTNTPTGWNWSFGDGTISTTQSPAHVYSSGGTYEVNLTVNNSNATYSNKLGSVEVWNYTSSGFTGTPTSGVVPLIVTFTDTSSNATNWTWTFGDGNTSIAKSPTFTYNVLGTYSVNHSANNTHDVSWTNRSSYITVTNASALLAQYNPWKTVSIWYPSGIYYNDTSLGTPISWNWTFGDGTNSTKQNPYKQWRAPGVYHVRLTVSNSYTTSSNSSWVQVLKWT